MVRPFRKAARGTSHSGAAGDTAIGRGDTGDQSGGEIGMIVIFVRGET